MSRAVPPCYSAPMLAAMGLGQGERQDEKRGSLTADSVVRGVGMYQAVINKARCIDAGPHAE